MDIDYEDENILFDQFIKITNFDKKVETKNDRQICEELSKIQKQKIKKIMFNYDNLNNLFLKSINDLGNDTKDFFKQQLSLIKKNRVIELKNGEAEIRGNFKKQEIYVTKKPFRDIDFLAFSHELGHISTFKNNALGDYYEYSEVLSIFLEYLSSISLSNNGDNSLFINNRLNISKEEALEFIKIDNEICYIDKNHYIYLQNLKKNTIKYICSFEYVLNLIDIYNEDKEVIKEMIDNIINGYSSFKEIENKLDLNINSYKQLKKIINNY